MNGADVPSAMPGVNLLDSLADKFGGTSLKDLPYSIDAMRPEIESAGEILFNIGRRGIGPGSLTAQEFEYIMSNPDSI